MDSRGSRSRFAIKTGRLPFGRMRKERVFLILAAAAVLFVVGLLFGALLRGWTGTSGGTKVYSTSAVIQQVQTLSQLVTVKYVMEKVQILEDPSQNPLRYLWPTYD